MKEMYDVMMKVSEQCVSADSESSAWTCSSSELAASSCTSSYHDAAVVGYCTVHDGLSTRKETQQILGFLCR